MKPFSYPRLARLREKYFSSPSRERGVVTVGELEDTFVAERRQRRLEGQSVGSDVLANDLGASEAVHEVGDSGRAVDVESS